ncbi:MAG TPA: hypothetical protein ENI85_17155 [Deltaproteobacteria bacterium]|nr:hypothetical protein [Deltaproteobacteria bacterium]
MITVALSATIGAPQDNVWRALTDPAARSNWDERILGAVGSARSAGKPRKGPGVSSHDASRDRPADRMPALEQRKWRFRLGGVPLVMLDTTIESAPRQRLVSRIAIGSIQFDQILTLHPEDDESGPRTRLGMKIVARNRIAVIGEVVQRLDVQKIVIEYVDTTLRQVQKYCEADT